jgi:hypothetical protein
MASHLTKTDQSSSLFSRRKENTERDSGWRSQRELLSVIEGVFVTGAACALAKAAPHSRSLCRFDNRSNAQNSLFASLDGRWTTLFGHETAPHRWLIGRMVSTSTRPFASASRHFFAGDHHLKRKRCGIGRSGMNLPRLEWPATFPTFFGRPEL